jgi:hypothetical protein
VSKESYTVSIKDNGHTKDRDNTRGCTKDKDHTRGCTKDRDHTKDNTNNTNKAMDQSMVSRTDLSDMGMEQPPFLPVPLFLGGQSVASLNPNPLY